MCQNRIGYCHPVHVLSRVVGDEAEGSLFRLNCPYDFSQFGSDSRGPKVRGIPPGWY